VRTKHATRSWSSSSPSEPTATCNASSTPSTTTSNTSGFASGAHLYRIDLDEYAHRFTYPAPGKTTGELHDTRVKETGDPVITIGYGPDFCVLRSDGVRLDIPNMVTELNEELPEAGVSGGGHLVVGSIKFVKGRRSAVIETLVEKMADAEIDEALSSTVAIDD